MTINSARPAPAGLQYHAVVVLIVLFTVCLLAVSGCATSGPTSANGKDAEVADTSNDPLEGFNRAMYRFNDVLDENALKPVAKGYKAITPRVVRRAVSNFFSNLFEPLVIVNDLLQAKFGQAASDTGRFIVNTTVGLVGLFDPATPMGMKKHNEDFGQTFGKWGVAPGPYLVLPFLGPRNFRDTAGWGADQFLIPINDIERSRYRWLTWTLYAIDFRTQLLGTKDMLEQAAGDDPYSFVREAYRQQRQNLIYDGNPPMEYDDLLFEDDPPAVSK
jgi:phospholipid-binding lipoprotein MlaA